LMFDMLSCWNLRSCQGSDCEYWQIRRCQCLGWSQWICTGH